MKKIFGNSLKRLIFKKGPVMVVFMTLLFFCLESGGESKGWMATDTYKVMNFSVLAIGLFFLLRKPTSQALNSRIKGIKDQLDELETKKKAAEKQLAEYNKKFSQLEQEAQKLIENYVRQGNEAKARIIDEAKQAAEKLEEQAQRNIEHEFKRAKIKLQEEILDKALVKTEKIIKNKITAQDQEKLVDEYLEKVVA
ncbi:MAG: F0F1 ATP synthase subunit B [Deltaproteobacteria bacterium]|nr:F0F1 ATP synthase subunit B [Deltaproteobacteria bacterium]